MSAKKYRVTLTKEERKDLQTLLRGGRAKARKIARAHVLLLADEGKTDEAIAEVLHVGLSTVGRTRQRFVEGGLEWALNERPRPGAARRLDGKAEAFLVALACSGPPEGRTRWTMQLLADRMVELGVVEELSDDTVRRTLKRGRLNPG
jgi:transposase